MNLEPETMRACNLCGENFEAYYVACPRCVLVKSGKNRVIDAPEIPWCNRAYLKSFSISAAFVMLALLVVFIWSQTEKRYPSLDVKPYFFAVLVFLIVCVVASGIRTLRILIKQPK